MLYELLLDFSQDRDSHDLLRQQSENSFCRAGSPAFSPSQLSSPGTRSKHELHDLRACTETCSGFNNSLITSIREIKTIIKMLQSWPGLRSRKCNATEILMN